MIKIKEYERALKFVNGEFKQLVKAGRHFGNPVKKVEFEVFDVRQLEVKTERLDYVWRNREEASEMEIVKILDGERGLLTINGRVERFLAPGIHAFWKVFEEVEIEVFKIGKVFVHGDLESMSRRAEGFPDLEFYTLEDNKRALISINNRFYDVFSAPVFAFWKEGNAVNVEKIAVDDVFIQHSRLNDMVRTSSAIIEKVDVSAGQIALVNIDGKLEHRFSEGRYAYWKGIRKVDVQIVDLRESTFEITGQEIMTGDKVSLRVNALVTYKVQDAVKAIQEFQDYQSALYKEAQMILRSAIGSRDLDSLLSDKESLEQLVESSIREAGMQMGLDVRSLGLKDIILPGDMKDILNRVTEARKVAEASYITRREETAAMRSQANTAKIMEQNPILLKLRELEMAEKVASNAALTIIAGDKGVIDSLRTLA
ncbi:slipin family protein [Lentisphaera marina]|uniref:slipin family protein n=1 Tax=Lentisphaera marina TaxID=1111041 RepID=UPI002366AD04|nr:slipin family protein [Lentisphaera marina]MDD7987331.1 slipin family protein [Lentisphaera marina]